MRGERLRLTVSGEYTVRRASHSPAAPSRTASRNREAGKDRHGAPMCCRPPDNSSTAFQPPGSRVGHFQRETTTLRAGARAIDEQIRERATDRRRGAAAQTLPSWHSTPAMFRGEDRDLHALRADRRKHFTIRIRIELVTVLRPRQRSSPFSGDARTHRGARRPPASATIRAR